MIVKIKNSNSISDGSNSWSYFECTIIHSKYCFLEDLTVNGGFAEDVILLVDTLKSNIKDSNISVRVLNLESEKSHLRTVVTDRVCYILNDQGKTIDKI